MLRMITDVSNINYWLRCQGDLLLPETASAFDANLRQAIETTLGGAIPDHAWWQAQLSVKRGGLGLRCAVDSAPLAFLSSRVAARPMVEDLFFRMQKKGLCKAHEMMTLFDERNHTCVNKLAEKFNNEVRTEEVRRILQEGALRAKKVWADYINEDTAKEDEDINRRKGPDKLGREEFEDSRDALRLMGTPGSGLVTDAGAEDPEHPYAKQRGPRLQRMLLEHLDEWRLAGLQEEVHDGSADGGFSHKRLQSLQSKTVNHAWMWNLSEHQGGCIADQGEYREAIRVRLGAGGPTSPILCQVCRNMYLDPMGEHSSKCCVGEATRGHNACGKVLWGYALDADPGAEREPAQLVQQDPALRPADLLTSASGRQIGADIGITSPSTACSGDKAMKNMVKRKKKNG